MPHAAQANFRRRVKVWLAHNDLTVTALAQRMKRRRDTVSGAINGPRFPRVRKEIERYLS